MTEDRRCLRAERMNNMKDFVKVDPNFLIETTIERDEIRFCDVEEAPFRIHGIFKENGCFRRIPEAVAQQVSPGVCMLHTNGAGGRVRFITDSPYVAIKTEYEPNKMSHFALTGSSGFDIYEDIDDESRYLGTFKTPFDVENGYESVVDFPEQRERCVTINFPLFSTVHKLYVGLQEGSVLKVAPDYKRKKPVVFYGSSITQGGCASRPGNSYESLLSRQFGFDYINLGFSGNAKGEQAIADYIKKLDMSVFVYDYDWNAPDPEHLEKTHSQMFQTIRSAQPELPIIIMAQPTYYLSSLRKKRRDVIENTYLEAKKQGDKNVYFLDGPKLMALVKDNGTVDGIHPTDSGFLSMAQAVGAVMETIWTKNEGC